MGKNALYWMIAIFLGYILFSPSKKNTASVREINVPTPVYSISNYSGYGCTDDCSGHQAGYDWAELNDITDPYDCSGNSQSFIEGCEEYAEEHSDENER